jgi:hypothetical protein
VFLVTFDVDKVSGAYSAIVETGKTTVIGAASALELSTVGNIVLSPLQDAVAFNIGTSLGYDTPLALTVLKR